MQLDYRVSGDGGCVDEDGLRHMVAVQLGRDPFRTVAAQRVAISLSRTDAGFQARIVWTEADGQSVGQRLLSSHGRDCREIAENVAFAVALQLQLIDRGERSTGGQGGGVQPPPVKDDEGRAPPPKEPDPSVPPTSPREEAPGPPAASQEPTPADRPPAQLTHPPELAVGIGPALALGLSPEATGAGRLFVDLRYGKLSAALAADIELPVTQRARDASGVRMNAWGYSAAGCAHLSLVGACLLGRVGWLRARGFGVDAPLTSSAHFYETGVRLVLAKQVGRLVVSARADGLVMLSRWNVALHDSIFWTLPRLNGLFGLDVAYKFF